RIGIRNMTSLSRMESTRTALLMMKRKTQDETIRQQIAAAQNFVIVGHIRPDGDAVGSMLGLTSALRASGKHVACVLQDGMPEKYAFLPGAAEVWNSVPQNYDYLIVVDSSDKMRT